MTSEAAAVKVVGRFFSGSGDSTSVTPEEIYAAMMRTPGDARNAHWLSNKLISLKHHGLVSPVYSPSYRLERIKLTPKGRDLLGKSADRIPAFEGVVPDSQPAASVEMSMKAVGAFLARWEKENPSFRVTLSIDLRK